MEIITKRIGTVRDIGNTFGLTLREELMDIGAKEGTEVIISVIFESKKKKIIIENIENK